MCVCGGGGHLETAAQVREEGGRKRRKVKNAALTVLQRPGLGELHAVARLSCSLLPPSLATLALLYLLLLLLLLSSQAEESVSLKDGRDTG